MFAPRICPDGKQLTIDTNIAPDFAVYVMNLPGPSTMRRFTMKNEDDYPIWSADGLRILFISVRNGQPAIYSQPVIGIGEAEQLTELTGAKIQITKNGGGHPLS